MYAQSTCRLLVMNVEARRRERTKQNAGREISTKQGFLNKNVRGFRYKPRENWFSFAKVRKRCFLCFCKETLVFSRLTFACATHTSYVIRQKGSLSWTFVRQLMEITQNYLYRYKYVYIYIYFFFSKTHRFATGLYSLPWSRVRHVLT